MLRRAKKIKSHEVEVATIEGYKGSNMATDNRVRWGEKPPPNKPQTNKHRGKQGMEGKLSTFGVVQSGADMILHLPVSIFMGVPEGRSPSGTSRL